MIALALAAAVVATAAPASKSPPPKPPPASAPPSVVGKVAPGLAIPPPAPRAPSAPRRVASGVAAVGPPPPGEVVATLTIPDSPGLVAAYGNHVYVTTELLGRPPTLQVYHVSDPRHPRLTGVAQLHAWAQSLSLSPNGAYAYVVTTTVGYPRQAFFEVVDVRDPARPAAVGRLDGLHGDFASSFVVPSLPYDRALAFDGEAREIDVHDPAHPVQIGAYTVSAAFGAAPDSFLINGETAGAGGHLTILDISNPAQVRFVTTIPAPNQATGIVSDGRYVYAVFEGDDLVILDSRSLPPFTQVAHVHTLPYPRIMSVSPGGYLFLATTDGDVFQVVDIHNPAAPMVSPNLYAGEGGHLEFGVVVGDYAYVATAATNHFRVIKMK
jgi:hypothetical protein